MISFKGIPVTTMFKILHQGTHYTVDILGANRIFSICCLTVTFSLFLLVLSIVYINPNLHVYYYCEYKRVSVPEILYTEPSSPPLAIKYLEVVSVDDYGSDSDHSFLPDVSDLEVSDDSEFYEHPTVVQPQPDKYDLSDTTDREALTAVKMALKFKQMNQFEKARKLFQHAMVLSPKHHDVLLHYGEFLESDKDFINADHFYLKALMIRPKNSRALTNRQRTLPVVNQMDLEELKRIDMKRAALVSLNKKDPTLKRLKKEIYFQHIHHSVAIEGNTMSLAETRTVVETGLAVSGKSILEHNEILGVEAALRYVNQTLASKNYYITVNDILEIHRRVMGHVDPITAGTFRKSQVFVGEHTPPAASDVELLMEEFVQLLQTPHITDMHPVHIAAFAHHKLVYIHPFIDGNGRTARLLMNLLFIRYGYPPIIIRKEDRSQYYKYLQIANEGDSRPFYRFIARATEYTLDAFLHAHEFKNSKFKALESNYDVKDIIPLRT